MNNPYNRERLTTIVLAGLIIAAVIVAIPSGSSTQHPPAPAATVSAAPADEHHGRLHERRAAQPRAQADLVSPELAAPVHDWPGSPERLNHAVDAATRFAVAYATRRYDETAEQRDARLAPMLTPRGARLLEGGSSALAELDEQRRRQEATTAELAFLEPVAVAEHRATYLVVLRATVSDHRGSRVVERAYTVTVVARADGSWAVDGLGLA